jgi:hypothetical protein
MNMDLLLAAIAWTIAFLSACFVGGGLIGMAIAYALEWVMGLEDEQP